MSNAQTVWQFTICVCTVGMAVSCLIEEKETMYVQTLIYIIGAHLRKKKKKMEAKHTIGW